MKLDSNVKKALWTLLGIFAFITISGVVVSALTGNVWFGLLASFVAIILVMFITASVVIVIAASRAFSGLDKDKGSL